MEANSERIRRRREEGGRQRRIGDKGEKTGTRERGGIGSASQSPLGPLTGGTGGALGPCSETIGAFLGHAGASQASTAYLRQESGKAEISVVPYVREALWSFGESLGPFENPSIRLLAPWEPHGGMGASLDHVLDASRIPTNPFRNDRRLS